MEMKNIQFKKEKIKPYWSKIIEEWFNVLDLASELSDGKDSPYVHTEQGNTHALAIAASNCGYATMREVYGKRKGKNQGKLDLCFYDKGFIECVESKWDEFDGVESKLPPMHKITDAVYDASNFYSDYALFDGERSISKTGVLFLTPHFKEVTEENINFCIKKVIVNHNVDAVAYYFNMRNKINYFCKDRLYPGVMMLIKQPE